MHGEQEIEQDPEEGRAGGRQGWVLTRPRALGLRLRVGLELRVPSEGAPSFPPGDGFVTLFYQEKCWGEGRGRGQHHTHAAETWGDTAASGAPGG